ADGPSQSHDALDRKLEPAPVTLEPVQASWEWRALRMLLRAAFYCFFIVYLIVAGSGTWSWAKREYYRAALSEPWTPHIIALAGSGDTQGALFLYTHARD